MTKPQEVLAVLIRIAGVLGYVAHLSILVIFWRIVSTFEPLLQELLLSIDFLITTCSLAALASIPTYGFLIARHDTLFMGWVRTTIKSLALAAFIQAYICPSCDQTEEQFVLGPVWVQFNSGVLDSSLAPLAEPCKDSFNSTVSGSQQPLRTILDLAPLTADVLVSNNGSANFSAQWLNPQRLDWWNLSEPIEPCPDWIQAVDGCALLWSYCEHNDSVYWFNVGLDPPNTPTEPAYSSNRTSEDLQTWEAVVEEVYPLVIFFQHILYDIAHEKPVVCYLYLAGLVGELVLLAVAQKDLPSLYFLYPVYLVALPWAIWAHLRFPLCSCRTLKAKNHKEDVETLTLLGDSAF